MYLPNLIENSDRKVFGRPAEVLHPPAEVLSGRRRRPPGGPTKRQKFSDNYVTNMSPNRARPNDALAARGPRFPAHPIGVSFLPSGRSCRFTGHPPEKRAYMPEDAWRHRPTHNLASTFHKIRRCCSPPVQMFPACRKLAPRTPDRHCGGPLMDWPYFAATFATASVSVARSSAGPPTHTTAVMLKCGTCAPTRHQVSQWNVGGARRENSVRARGSATKLLCGAIVGRYCACLHSGDVGTRRRA